MKIIALLFSVLILSACTHPISLKPEKLDFTVEEKINGDCGIVFEKVSLEKLTKETRLSGDSYEYKENAHLKFSYMVLARQLCKNATFFEDEKTAAQSSLTTFFVPEITDIQSKSGFFTWPPTEFRIKTKTQIFGKNANLIQVVNAEGFGAVKLMDMKGNFGAAGGASIRENMENFLQKIDVKTINNQN